MQVAKECMTYTGTSMTLSDVSMIMLVTSGVCTVEQDAGY